MKKKNFVLLIIIVLLILSVTIGYSILSVPLNINGLSSINNSTWDIHFENIQVKDGSVIANVPTISTNRTVVTYSVELNKPGDYFEFTVDVKNDGTIDGMVESVISKLNNEEITVLPEYLEYSATYADGAEIKNNQLLASNDKETIKIFVGYKKDIDSSMLPTSVQTLDLRLDVTYVQATNEAFKIRTYKYAVVYGNHIFIPGQSPNPIEHLYDSFEELQREVSANFALKVYMVNNTVVNCGISFKENGKEYYLKGGDGGESYDLNKNILDEVFGVNNCSFNNTYQSYICNNGPYNSGYFGATIYLNGSVSISDYGSNAQVSENGKCFFSS